MVTESPRRIVSSTSLVRAIIILWMAFCTPSGHSQSIESVQLESVERGAAQGASRVASVALEIVPGSAGGSASAEILFDTSMGLHGFNLLLHFEPGHLLSANTADFQRSPAFFPEARLGDHSLNSARDAGPGRVRIIGLAPVTATGSTEIGYLRLHISPNAPISATQVVTLTGEINQAGTGIVAIAPVTATVQVIRMDQRVYLPLILRAR